MLIVQMTDFHITAEGQFACGQVDTRAHLRRAVAHVQNLSPRPDVVLVSGDLADNGLPEEYAFVGEQLQAIPCPVYVVPGNHDDCEALRDELASHAYLPRSGPLHYAIDDGPVRIIALDTLVAGAAHGALSAESLDWLEARLSEDDRPTLIMMHHPPARTGIDKLDELGLTGGRERLGEVLRRHRHVVLLACGHFHRPLTVPWAGTLVSVAPGVAHQITLDLNPGAPLSVTMDPPAIALHLWRPGEGLVSHLSFIGEFARF